MANHPLEEHAKHLRLTNFTLMLLCVGMLIALSDPYLQRVRSDLNRIETILRHLAPFEEALLNDNRFKSAAGPFLLSSRLAEALPPKPKIQVSGSEGKQGHLERYTAVSIEGIKKPVSTHFDLPLAIVVHNEEEYSQLTLGVASRLGIRRSDERIRLWEEYRAAPKSTEKFRGLWNTLDEMDVYVAELEERLFAVYRIVADKTGKVAHDYIADLVGLDTRFGFKEIKFEVLKKKYAPNSATLYGAPIKKGLLESRHVWNRVARGYFAVIRVDESGRAKQVNRWNEPGAAKKDARIGDYLIVRNIRFNRRSLRLQERLLAGAFPERPEAKAIRPGAFEDSFPALHDYIAGLGDERVDVDFDSLSLFLDRDLARGNAPLEIMGIKIQAGAISFWGLIILIAIQIYFAVHFTAFAGKLESSTDRPQVPWIGLYGRGIASWMLIAGVVVLPSYTAAATAYGAVVYRNGDWGYWALGAASVALGLVTWRTIDVFLKSSKSA